MIDLLSDNIVYHVGNKSVEMSAIRSKHDEATDCDYDTIIEEYLTPVPNSSVSSCTLSPPLTKLSHAEC